MNAQERLIAAIRQRPVDRVPVMTYNFHPFDGRWRRNPDGSYAGPPGYQPMMDAVWRTGAGMLVKVAARYAGDRQERTRVERTTRGSSEVRLTTVETPKGALHARYEKPAGQPGHTVKPLIADDEDLARYLSLSDEPSEVDLSPAIEVYEALGDRGLAYLHYEDPMYAVAQLFDAQDFYLRCATQRASIVEMIERASRRALAEMEEMLAQAEGYDLLFYSAGVEVATPPMLSPAAFAELVTPYERALVRMIRGAGHLSAIHCHGRVGRLLDQFLEIGVHALEPLEPPPQGDVSLEQAFEAVRGRICLMGYIQDQDLYTAQPGEMRDKVRAIRQVVEGRTGYIMTSTATPYMDPPPPEFVRNYVEYLEAATG
jgi:AcrR family transcriptional regulator